MPESKSGALPLGYTPIYAAGRWESERTCNLARKSNGSGGNFNILSVKFKQQFALIYPNEITAQQFSEVIRSGHCS